jgi:hypothetical protein
MASLIIALPLLHSLIYTDKRNIRAIIVDRYPPKLATALAVVLAFQIFILNSLIFIQSKELPR